MKKEHFFNHCFKERVLDLEERTIGRTKAENWMLKVPDIDKKTSITKLASSERKLQNIR